MLFYDTAVRLFRARVHIQLTANQKAPLVAPSKRNQSHRKGFQTQPDDPGAMQRSAIPCLPQSTRHPHRPTPGPGAQTRARCRGRASSAAVAGIPIPASGPGHRHRPKAVGKGPHDRKAPSHQTITMNRADNQTARPWITNDWSERI
jgi:hypothetical protein